LEISISISPFGGSETVVLLLNVQEFDNSLAIEKQRLGREFG